ncbi:SDR family oxidoreductase [Mycobacterium sp. OTB74]|jgi:nucleoside-diphosphate-sugar epimerase|uniref:SDR family oxidoreductase n=1 Tax=Mycobacterium sp. OTB74 TaxID=1853452 RepID=UPI002474B796|nr:SDR family oxidoreductase [Mycobacterium sp. OTB74]MDH6244077.1 nucleoside-diphosphate-sugar epimerase [Mycobacterium sp. OTB74]
MRVFVTGASGFVGSAVVRELLGAGHQVIGLARSDDSAAKLTAAGARVHRGSLADPGSLREGAKLADGVVHMAFIHNFEDYAAAAEADRSAIETIGDALAGTDRPFVVTSGMASFGVGRSLTEEDPAHPASPRISETALDLADRGVRVSAVRLAPSVHGVGDHGFVPRLIEIARDKGISAYPGDGSNRWPAVDRLDAARLFRLALEGAVAGSRLHAVGDEGVPVRDIAEVIGRRLNLPVQSVPVERAFDHFGWLGGFFAMDLPASSVLTRQWLGWRAEMPGLIADLETGRYFDE